MTFIDIILAVAVVFLAGLVIALLSQNQRIIQFLPHPKEGKKTDERGKSKKPTNRANRIMVDTSVIIDGRIADIVETGFVTGTMYVPRFVLAELQNIADSEDQMRRNRGRRGLEVLNNMRSSSRVTIEVLEDNPSEIREVDAKLVAVAKKYQAAILTTDYNLNRVATIEKVLVLNINELANAIKPVVLPGEEMMVKIVQAGKEKHQGVGYLADGTMIVVEGGDKLIGQEVKTEVTRIFQTVAGKMIFAAQKNGSNGQHGHATGKNSTRNHQPKDHHQSSQSNQGQNQTPSHHNRTKNDQTPPKH